MLHEEDEICQHPVVEGSKEVKCCSWFGSALLIALADVAKVAGRAQKSKSGCWDTGLEEHTTELLFGLVEALLVKSKKPFDLLVSFAFCQNSKKFG